MSAGSNNNISKEEQDLIRKSQAGDEDAFAELIRRYRRKIFQLCYQIIGDREQAEDVTQETFIHAFQHLHTFKMQARFYTWIYRIAINLSINTIRKQQRGRAKASLTDYAYQTEAGQSYLERKQQNLEPFELKEIHEIIERGIKSLSPEHRQVLTMFDLDGMTHEEISRQLHLKSGTVRSRLHYARKKMKAFLSSYLFNPRSRPNH
jgi:RNA polymerase sigma-70 factor, ECF subfamily